MSANLNDPAVQAYCSQVLRPHLEILRKKAQSIQRRKNIEDIHDLRVSSRRIRTCLNVFADALPPKKIKVWQRDIKSITNAFSRVRDLDVQLDWITQMASGAQDAALRAGIRRVRLRLKQKRQVREVAMQCTTRAVLESASLVEMNAWLESIAQSVAADSIPRNALFQLGYEQVQKRLDEFLFFEVFIFDSSRIEELHRMRIAAKHLRYTLEIFSELYNGKTDFALDLARQSQQLLGEIHDADVWTMFLPRFMEKEQKRVLNFYGSLSPFNRLKPGLDYLLENRRQERNRLYDCFLNEWKAWKMKESWLTLRKVIFMANLESQKTIPPAPAAPEDQTASK